VEAPRDLAHNPWEETVDKQQSSAPAHPPTERDPDETPHLCNNGWVTLGQIVLDPETGEEAEEYALYLCRRCVETSR
jgi:hypothetical protein